MTDILINPGTPIIFKSTGGVLLTPTSITSGAGRISDRADRGATTKPLEYEWECIVKTAAAATIGRTLRLFAIQSSAATGAAGTDGGFSHSDAVLGSIELLRNLTPIGIVQADTTANPGTFTGRGFCWLTARYIQAAIWNDLNATLSATATDFTLTLTPIPSSF